MLFPDYHQDFSHLHVGTLPCHAYFIPFGDRESALRGERRDSALYLNLNGIWRFGYYESPDELPQELFSSAAVPGEIPVPSVWQSQGYDRPQYTNVHYPIPFDPPYVPRKNPCGLYRRSFSYTPDGRKAILCFEGVDSCFHLWLNGRYAGYSQVSHSPSEFDVTDLLRDGENEITALVLKWCDGTYFEDQDKFRSSGIFRDVYILTRQPDGILDFRVRTKLSETLDSAVISVSLDKAGDTPTDYELLDADGVRIASGTAQKAIEIALDHIALWNAEKPYLYTLLMRTGEEWIAEKIGLREIHIENGMALVNGVPVKFRGVNRHDSDPVTGPAADKAHMLRDLRLMKRHNINAIRTSHYPNAPEFLQLCDRYGFYVIAEADLETHGVVFLENGQYEEKYYNQIADDPQYGEVILDRVQRSVKRDINRPCVLIWSMGNESGMGVNIDRALAWTKAYDPSRLTHYERASFPPSGREINQTDLDLYSRMYPSIEEIDQYFAVGRINKPYILCEYSHAMGNGPGDLEDYFQCFHRHPGHCGGFIWEWCDHAVYLGEENGRSKYGYGGDSGEYPHDGNFCMDGLTYPDRRPHTGLIEYKNVLRPARIVNADVKNGKITLWNTLDFTNLRDAVTVDWEVRQGGRTLRRGTVEQELLDIPPHERREITLTLPDGLSGDFALHMFQRRKTDTPFVKAGEIVGEDEAGVQHMDAPVPVRADGILAVEETNAAIFLTGPRFHAVYSRETGCFDRWTVDGRDILTRPMAWNIWRAPTDNDQYIRSEWQRCGYDHAAGRAYDTQITRDGQDVVLETAFSVVTPFMPPVFKGQLRWRVSPAGVFSLELSGKRKASLPFLPRLGLRLFLRKDMDQLQYFGFGPYESYPDKHRASFRHLYATSVRDQHEDYIRPQENGSHWDCEYLRLDGPSACLTVEGSGFSFNASPYTQEELAEKKHNWELRETDSTVLCVDAQMSGVGSNSCGPALAEKYRAPARAAFACRFYATGKEEQA